MNLLLEEIFAVHTLRLYFLGTLDIRYDDQQLPKPATLKSQSLLAYLILHRHRPQPRDRLVGLFWGDRPERKARHSQGGFAFGPPVN